MCRILTGLIEEADPGIISRFLDSLIDASRSDPLNNGKPHPHGWGYILIGKGIYEYRSGLPIYSDTRAVEELRNKITNAPNIFIIHTRRKSPGTPIGSQHSHPYHYELENGIDMWIAFNGGIEVGDTRYRSDAYLLGRILAEKCGGAQGLDGTSDCIYSVYRELSGKITSGGNLAYLLYDGTMALLGFIPVYAGPKKTYYSHYSYRGSRVFLIASSSIIHIAGIREAERLNEWMHIRRKFVFGEHIGYH